MYTYCTIWVHMMIITSLGHSHMCKHVCILYWDRWQTAL